jgi:hypothetical protein
MCKYVPLTAFHDQCLTPHHTPHTQPLPHPPHDPTLGPRPPHPTPHPTAGHKNSSTHAAKHQARQSSLVTGPIPHSHAPQRRAARAIASMAGCPWCDVRQTARPPVAASPFPLYSHTPPLVHAYHWPDDPQRAAPKPGLIQARSRHVTSRHVTSCHVTSRHVTSRHVTSRHVTSRHVTSRHVTSRHVTSRCDSADSAPRRGGWNDRKQAPACPQQIATSLQLPLPAATLLS